MTARQRTAARDALDRATASNSLANYPAIIAGFKDRGIPESEILPRINVLTFAAWKAKGRFVRKGERGVRIVAYRSYIRMVEQSDGTSKPQTFKTPCRSVVFHESQTDSIDAPEPGKQYRLTGGSGVACIAAGSSWADSIVRKGDCPDCRKANEDGRLCPRGCNDPSTGAEAIR